MKAITDLRLIKAPLAILNTRQAGIVHARALSSAGVSLQCVVLVLTLTFALLLSGSTALCATHYVRAGATGSGTGADWNNAYANIPASLVRGDTYYIADGSYGDHAFGDAVSGTTTIVIKKATAADHGPDTGWNASYGQGQAVFGAWRFSYSSGSARSGYYDFEGYTAAVAGGYGFKVNCPATINLYNTGMAIIFVGGSSSCSFPYMIFRYVEVNGPYGSGTYNGGSVSHGGLYASGNDPSSDTSHMLVSHCWIHNGCTTPFQDNAGNNYMTVEYCDLCDTLDGGGYDHANIYWIGSSYGTFRYNLVHNWSAMGLFFGFATTGWGIYGNVFYNANGVAVPILLANGNVQSGLNIYNNTFVDIPSEPAIVDEGSGSTSGNYKDNLYVNASGAGGAGSLAVANNVTANTSAFVSYVSVAGPNNYRLKSPIAGTAVAAPYNMDPDGNTRGADGVWDVGAYEYGGLTTNPMIQVSPTQLAFGPVAAGASVTNTFTVQNAGNGTLSGTATVPTACTNYLRIVSGGTYSLGASQSQLVTVRYSPTTNGTDSGSITCSGGGGTEVSVAGSLLAVLSGLSFESYAGAITSPFTTNGGYVSQTVDVSDVNSGGQAVYAFNVTNGGNYTVSASVNAPSSSRDSFWVNIDALPTDPAMVWDISPDTVGFQTRTVSWRGSGSTTNAQYNPQVFNLSPGLHQLIIVGREANVQLGQITITAYGSSRPSPPSPPSNFHVARVQ